MRLAVIGAATVLAVAVLKLAYPGPLDRAEHAAYDFLVRTAGLPAPSGEVVVVTIDEASLRRIGRWPWPRARLGELISAILEAGAAVVALDIMFPEPDSGPAPDTTGRTNDDVLAASMARGRVVVGYYFDFRPVNPTGSKECSLHAAPLIVFGPHEPQDLPFFQATGAVCSIPVLSRAAKGSGFLNAGPDRDGKVRRASTLIRFNGLMHPSLALAAFLEREQVRGLTLRTEWHGGNVLQVGSRPVELERNGELMMRFHGASGSTPSFSAADVLARTVGRGAIRNKIVVVGGSAMGLQDVIATPVDPLLMGVEYQATAIDNLVKGDFLIHPPAAAMLEFILLLSLGLAAVSVVARFQIALGMAVMLPVIAGLWLTSSLLIRSVGWFVSPLTPTLAICSGIAVVTPLCLAAKKKKAEESARRQDAAKRFALMAVAGVVDLRTPGSENHTERMTRYMRLLSASAAEHPRFRSQLDPETIDLLVQLTPIHDLGKAGIPDRVLLKSGPLTAQEAEIMSRHVEYGRALIERAWRQAGSVDETVLRTATALVYSHHERWDGTGYPDGLSGDQIPLPARLLAIAEVYDTLVAADALHDPIPHDVAVRVLTTGRGTQFDPDLVDSFLASHESFRVIAEESRDNRRAHGTGA